MPPCVIGLSRGSELALLAAALTPDHVGPVVVSVGSGVAWGAWGPGTDVLETAWLFGGEPVPKMYEHHDDSYAVLDDADWWRRPRSRSRRRPDRCCCSAGRTTRCGRAPG